VERIYLLENNPALSREDWAPDSAPWPELLEVREQHLRLLRQVWECGDAVRELRRRYEAEDEARQDALKASFRNGAAEPLPPATPRAEREAALSELTEKVEAARKAFVDFLNEAFAIIKAHAPSWLASLEQRAEDADAMRDKARQMLREADVLEVEGQQLATWVLRAAKGNSGDQVAWGHINVPVTPREEIDWATIAGEVAHA
jgi:hypothetical protein